MERPVNPKETTELAETMEVVAQADKAIDKSIEELATIEARKAVRDYLFELLLDNYESLPASTRDRMSTMLRAWAEGVARGAMTSSATEQSRPRSAYIDTIRAEAKKLAVMIEPDVVF